MPLELPANNPSLVIRRPAFERAGMERAAIDERLGLTDQEFRVEGDLIVVGPIINEGALHELLEDFETAGLVQFEAFFDFSGNWTDWLQLYARGSGASPR
jgi:hypothetical protein